MVTLGQHVYNTVVFLVYQFLSANVPSTTNVHPEEGLNIREQIAKHGYPLEEHQIQTADGYLLTLFRIPHGIRSDSGASSNTPNTRPPVLIMHGFLSSAQDYVVMGPNISMAYKLAEDRYDIWLGNSRGNTWSRKHIKFHPDEPRFWAFSFHEVGYYDLPAQIDHIRNITGHDSMYYIGHSQGCTSMFVMASERPEYIKKIKLFVAMAPVAYPGVMPAVLPQVVATFYKYFEWIIDTFDYVEFLPHGAILNEALLLLCRNGMPYHRICQAFFAANFGFSQDMDEEMASLVLNSFPAGSSTRQLLHFIQNKVTDSFRKYDYGETLNMRIYGQWQPPKYNIRTNLPTALIYSDNDWVSTTDDVNRISSELKNLKLKFKLPGPYTHVDYLYGRQANKILLDVILKLFREN